MINYFEKEFVRITIDEHVLLDRIHFIHSDFDTNLLDPIGSKNAIINLDTGSSVLYHNEFRPDC